MARREYEAHGLPFHDTAHALGSLAEACTIIPAAVDRLPSRSTSYGTYHQLTGAFGSPKPVQRPHPADHDWWPLQRGTLRVVAEHADLWNIPGGDIEDAVGRSALYDRYCAELGRDPASIIRSLPEDLLILRESDPFSFALTTAPAP